MESLGKMPNKIDNALRLNFDEQCLECKRKSRLYNEYCDGLPPGAFFLGACQAEKYKARQRWLKENAS